MANSDFAIDLLSCERMTSEELKEILATEEGLKLDFKGEYHLNKNNSPLGTNPQRWSKYVDGQWDELIKDIISLTNGNVGTASKAGKLIIGAADRPQVDGSRALFDTANLNTTAQQVMAKLNSACVPAIPEVLLEKVELEGKLVTIITIPPSPYIHECSRDLQVTKGYFDAKGVLTKFDKKNYTRHTAFIRKGEDILPASNVERRALEEDKKFGLLVTNQNLKSELVYNLKLLLWKSSKSDEILDLSILTRKFIEKYHIKMLKDLVIEKRDFSLIAPSLMVASKFNAKSTTKVLDDAILSGRYLTFDTVEGRYLKGDFLEGLLELQERIKRLKMINEVSDMIVKYAPSIIPGHFIHISSNDSLLIGATLNLYQDVVNLCSALLLYLLGNRSRLDNLTLTDVVPDKEEAEKLRREELSEEEVVIWVLNQSQ